MSDFMLLGILRMPIEADDGVVAFTQFRSAARSAADRIEQLVATNEQLTAERDAAYAQGYSDAETEISKSALGQRNYFLHSQYENATDHIKVLTTERDRLREALEQIEITCEEEIHARTAGMSDAALGKSRILPLLQIPRNIARAALKGESNE